MDSLNLISIAIILITIDRCEPDNYEELCGSNDKALLGWGVPLKYIVFVLVLPGQHKLFAYVPCFSILSLFPCSPEINALSPNFPNLLEGLNYLRFYFHPT